MTWTTDEGGQRPLFGESQSRFDESMFRSSDTVSVDTTSPTYIHSRNVETIETILDDTAERTIGAAALAPVLRPHPTGYAEKHGTATDPTPSGLNYSA